MAVLLHYSFSQLYSIFSHVFLWRQESWCFSFERIALSLKVQKYLKYGAIVSYHSMALPNLNNDSTILIILAYDIFLLKENMIMLDY